MQINLNQIYKIVAVLFSLIFLYFLFYFMFGNSSEGKANTSVVMQDLSLLTKSIAINQNDSGSYGAVTENLPYIGCSLANSYLDNDEVRKILERQADIRCVSDGSNGQIKSWAISSKLAEGKYWCVDESGDRLEITKHVTKSTCK